MGRRRTSPDQGNLFADYQHYRELVGGAPVAVAEPPLAEAPVEAPVAASADNPLCVRCGCNVVGHPSGLCDGCFDGMDDDVVYVGPEFCPSRCRWAGALYGNKCPQMGCTGTPAAESPPEPAATDQRPCPRGPNSKFLAGCIRCGRRPSVFAWTMDGFDTLPAPAGGEGRGAEWFCGDCYRAARCAAAGGESGG